MKKIVFIFLVTASVVVFESCEKCQKCSYSYTDTSGEVITSDVGDACGDQAQLDQMELDCESAAQTVGGTCECTVN